MLLINREYVPRHESRIDEALQDDVSLEERVCAPMNRFENGRV